MKIEIRKYNDLKEYEELLNIIKSEGEEWEDCLSFKYRNVLKKSITYVAYIDEELCGYSRSIDDFGLSIWVVDLLVGKKYRGNSVGKRLMECLLEKYADQDVFVMSDVDEYYTKIGYKKEGSIFRVG